MGKTSRISSASIVGHTRALVLAVFATLPLLGPASVAVRAQPAPTAQTNQHGNEHGGGIDKRVDQILLRMNATADQQTKVHAIVQTAKTDIAPMHASMRVSRKQMRMLLSAPQIDTAAIETLRAQNSATMDKISRLVSAATIEAANVFTPDQRAKFAMMGPGHGPNRPQ